MFIFNFWLEKVTRASLRKRNKPVYESALGIPLCTHFFDFSAMLSSLSMHVCACCCMDSLLKFFCSLLFFSSSCHAFPPAIYFSAFLAFFARFFPRHICCCSFSFNNSSTRFYSYGTEAEPESSCPSKALLLT